MEKALTFIKRATRLVKKEDYELFKLSHLNKGENLEEVENLRGNLHFNDLMPMHTFEDLERIHNDPAYNERL